MKIFFQLLKLCIAYFPNENYYINKGNKGN